MRYNFKRYCKNYQDIENFEKAKVDDFVGWHCHHRLQTWTSDGKRRAVDITAAELRALGMYYNRPAEELIFLTDEEHGQLHQKGKKRSDESKKKMSEAQKGHPVSEETKKKIGESNKGHLVSEETRKKMSEAKQNISEETKKKMGAAKKGNIYAKVNRGKRWFNNGKENKFCFECPEGFVPGRLKRKFR